MTVLDKGSYHRALQKWSLSQPLRRHLTMHRASEHVEFPGSSMPSVMKQSPS